VWAFKGLLWSKWSGHLNCTVAFLTHCFLGNQKIETQRNYVSIVDRCHKLPKWYTCNLRMKCKYMYYWKLLWQACYCRMWNTITCHKSDPIFQRSRLWCYSKTDWRNTGN
jgi:hypothetical protein